MSEWTEIKTQADADVLMETFGQFHDSCLREAHLTTGSWVGSDLAMSCPNGFDNTVRMLFQRQVKNPSAVELHFDEVTRFNLAPSPEDYDSIILQATLLIRAGSIFWSENGSWTPESADRDEVTWISAKKLRWRAIDWLGEELRYGPKTEP